MQIQFWMCFRRTFKIALKFISNFLYVTFISWLWHLQLRGLLRRNKICSLLHSLFHKLNLVCNDMCCSLTIWVRHSFTLHVSQTGNRRISKIPFSELAGRRDASLKRWCLFNNIYLNNSFTFDANEIARSRYAEFPILLVCPIIRVTRYLKPFKMHVVPAEV